MDLTMSMFATQADYWKARADLAEVTVRETAAALGCKPDNEAMLAAAQDAVRYRWLRDTATTCRAVQLVQWMPDKMDAKIDAEMAPRRAALSDAQRHGQRLRSSPLHLGLGRLFN